MAEKMLNIKVCSPLKLRSGLIGNYHVIYHYSYNLPSPQPSLRRKFQNLWFDQPIKILVFHSYQLCVGACIKSNFLIFGQAFCNINIHTI